MQLKSSAFGNGQPIPGKFTCDGADISPPLEWEGIPDEAISLALICDDPDAPVGTWVHWVYFNLSVDAGFLPEDVGPQEMPEIGGVQGRNDFGRIGYGGPCPPGGTHRYFFKLYALDAMLDLGAGAPKEALLKAMEGHIMDQTEMVGTYRRG